MLVGTRTFWNRLRRPFAQAIREIAFPLIAIALLCFSSEMPRASAQTLTSLHNFGLSPDGDEPLGPLALAADGSFVGTTGRGGANGTGCVYEITASGKETILYSFTALNATDHINVDGARPTSGVILGADGNYYGCTTTGGTSGNGTIFQLTPAGVFTTLVDFQGSDGSSPIGLVESSTAGIFYGTTETGGDNNTGTVFELVVTTTTTVGTTTTTTSAGAGVTLYSFSALDSSGTNSDGAYPTAAPIIGANGDLYGTTSGGGNSTGSGLTSGEAVGGTVWTLPVTGTTLTVLHLFTALDANSFNSDGTRPQAGLTQITDGTFVGCCKDGGVNGTGTLFDITTTGTYTVLHTFSAVPTISGFSIDLNVDGSGPAVNLVQLASGTIYGTCSAGGFAGEGTIFSYTPATTAAPTAEFSTYYSFGAQTTSVQGGNDPLGVLAEDAAGNLYGTTANGGLYTGYAGSGFGGIFFQLPLGAASTAAPPTVTGLSPSSAQAGGNDFTVAITGTGFDSASVVHWKATSTLTVALTTTYLSATQLTAIVPANLIGIDAVLNAGTAEAHAVSIVNTDTGAASVTSASSTFTVNPSTSTAPTIKTLSPAAVTTGTKATPLVITGIHFFTGDTVTINRTVLTPIEITATQISVTLPASVLTKAQSLSVTVSSSAGSSNALALTVTPLTSYATGLQFISLPYDYPDVALSTIFGYANPKLAVWNTASSVYTITPNAPADAIRLGRGYWVRFPGTAGVQISGTPATAGTAFTINLAKGWNMIGDPFVTAVSGTGITITTSSTTSYTFSDAAANAIIGSNTYSYQPSTNSYVGDNSGDMQPFVGYWIYADQACSMIVNGS